MKILLVQTSFLGDLVLSTPVIAALKSKYPDSELWLMVHKAAVPLVERDPLLAGLFVDDKHGRDGGPAGFFRILKRLKAARFDKVYSLHKSPRTALILAASRIPSRIGFDSAKLSFLYTARRARPLDKHDVVRNLALLSGEGNFSDDLRLYPPPIEDAFRRLGISELLGKQFVTIVPGSVWKTKMWNVEGYHEVAKHFRKLDTPVVILGAPDECGVAERASAGLDVINLVGKTGLSDMLAVVSRSSLQVCNDSLAMHVASAFKVPTVAIFCSTTPAFGFGPWKTRNTVLEVVGLPCKPCGRHGRRSCPTGTEACMRQLSSVDVISAAEELIR